MALSCHHLLFYLLIPMSGPFLIQLAQLQATSAGVIVCVSRHFLTLTHFLLCRIHRNLPRQLSSAPKWTGCLMVLSQTQTMAPSGMRAHGDKCMCVTDSHRLLCLFRNVVSLPVAESNSQTQTRPTGTKVVISKWQKSIVHKSCDLSTRGVGAAKEAARHKKQHKRRSNKVEFDE